MKARMTGIAATFLLASAVMAGCGAGGGNGETKTGAGEATAVAGGNAEALYKKQCISCHGDQLQGRIGPGTNLTKVGGKLTREQIATQIEKGGNGMPGFKGSLNEAEIGTLADWLAAKK
ncbi:c-type cytochrome [Paenibacillus sp. GYB003]|uniref:c-type cytochrome n=1 Tax=Paenibacillus sp. GYB003 TaxID=2994392 RepID=UPI002F96B8DE